MSGDTILLSDLGSSNGTTFEEKRLTPHEQYGLRHEDSFEIGEFIFKIELITQPVATRKEVIGPPEVLVQPEPSQPAVEPTDVDIIIPSK